MLGDNGQAILETIRSIDSCSTEQETLDVYTLFTSEFGLTNYLVSQVVHPLKPNADKAMLHTNWPNELISERFAGMQLLHDPVVRYAIGSRFPFSWDIAYRHASKFGKRMMDKTREFRVGDGFTFPMRRPGVPIGGISLGGDKPEIDPGNLAGLEMVSMHCYSKLESLHPPFPFQDIEDLSPQETEVLHFAAVGKSAWETGGAMEISEAAVKDALKRARKKLGAVNTIQACTIALSRDLILP